MKRHRALLLGLAASAALIAAGCGHAAESESVPLKSLVATPKAYDGKVVRLIGFFDLESGGGRLYVAQSDHAAVSGNSVWIDTRNPVVPLDANGLSGRYVLVEGRFDADDKGRGGTSAGALGRISTMEYWPSTAEFRAMH